MPDWVKPLADGDRTLLDRLGAAIRTYYMHALAPHWDSIHRRVETDRAARARACLAGGAERVLTGLHPAISWFAPVLRVRYPGPDRDLHLQGRGLVLVPRFFGSQPASLCDPAMPPVLAYPTPPGPRWFGTGGKDSRAVAASLDGLIGRTRAAVLEAIGTGRTTGEIARELRISAASASEHATTLRNAGLITSDRRGNAVRHEVTRLGAELLRANHP